MPNNRQWALIAFLFLAVALALLVPKLRASVRLILRAFLVPKVLAVFLALLCLIAVEVWLGAALGIWTPALATDTAFFVLVAAGLLLEADDVQKDPHFFRNAAAVTLGASALIEVIGEQFVLPLWVELLLVPILVVLGGLVVAGRYDEGVAAVGRGARVLLWAIGFGLLAYSVTHLIGARDDLDWSHFARQVVLRWWLMLGVLPFVYAIALFSLYERFHKLMTVRSPLPRSKLLRTDLLLFSTFRFRVRALATAEPGLAWKLGQATSVEEAGEVISASQARQTERAHVARASAERLVALAGVEGTDEEGRQLDRREFKETRDALIHFHLCMIGWYRHPGSRYPDDLLERFRDDFTRQGLPTPSGIEVHVARDGQSWYAWRRSVTGWCFAIGADGPPPRDWRFDGPEPPRGFPGEHADWGANWVTGHTSPNWIGD